MFGVLVIFSMGTLLPTMVQAFQANLLAASGQVDVTITHKTNEAFSRTVLTRVKNIQGIRALTSSLSRTVNVPAGFFRDARVTAVTLLLAAIGTAFGLLAGLYLGYVMVLGLSVGGFPVAYTFPLTGLIAAIAVGLLFGALAALTPARQAARLEIIRALRYE